MNSLTLFAIGLAMFSLNCDGTPPGDGGTTVDSCMIDASCFQATGLAIEELTVCKLADAAVTTQPCPTGHVGCCVQSDVLGSLNHCFYPPTTVDAAANECASVDGGTFVPN